MKNRCFTVYFFSIILFLPFLIVPTAQPMINNFFCLKRNKAAYCNQKRSNSRSHSGLQGKKRSRSRSRSKEKKHCKNRKSQSIVHINNVFDNDHKSSLKEKIKKALQAYTKTTIGELHALNLQQKDQDDFADFCETVLSYEQRSSTDEVGGVFYHATKSWTGLLHDFYRTMYCCLHGASEIDGRQIFKSFLLDESKTSTIQSLKNLITAKNVAELETNNGKNDHSPIFKENGLSANLSLFGSFYCPGESTLAYLINEGSINPEMSKSNYLKNTLMIPFLKKFNIDDAAAACFIDEIISKYEQYALDKANRLYQIMINKSCVNDLAYLATPYGKLFSNNGFHNKYLLGLIDIKTEFTTDIILQKYASDAQIDLCNFDQEDQEWITRICSSVELPRGKLFRDIIQARILLNPCLYSTNNKVKTVTYFWEPENKNYELQVRYELFLKDLNNICTNIIQKILVCNLQSSRGLLLVNN